MNKSNFLIIIIFSITVSFSQEVITFQSANPFGLKDIIFEAQTNEKRLDEEKNMLINTEKNEFEINPDGGYKHFGNVNGDFIVVKGSVPGTYRRLIKLRHQIRNEPKKILKPNIVEVVLP